MPPCASPPFIITGITATTFGPGVSRVSDGAINESQRTPNVTARPLTTLVTALAMNHVHRGSYMP